MTVGPEDRTSENQPATGHLIKTEEVATTSTGTVVVVGEAVTATDMSPQSDGEETETLQPITTVATITPLPQPTDPQHCLIIPTTGIPMTVTTETTHLGSTALATTTTAGTPEEGAAATRDTTEEYLKILQDTMTVMTVEDGAITQAITRTDITTTAAVLHGTTGTEMYMGVDTKAETEENEATVLDQITTRNPRGEMIGTTMIEPLPRLAMETTVTQVPHRCEVENRMKI
ncbi:mucin-2-like [Symsagittifera roscoffensis]|uniref:mucin-2-like n=1 Tax=Symsagittifera roscoffensis TaxID=84072 RepID=UPI00307B2242